jgi:hypothetical protein
MATNPRIGPVERATEKSWDEWLGFMAAIGAEHLDHHQIALRVHEELGDSVEQRGWWAQSVTVAYEQHVGRRIPGQRADGTFQVGVSRSTALGTAELMERWAVFAAADGTVRGIVAGTPRVSGTDRRITWRTKAADGSSVVVTSEPKRNGTASLVVTQVGLPTPESHGEARERWAATVARFLGSL